MKRFLIAAALIAAPLASAQTIAPTAPLAPPILNSAALLGPPPGALSAEQAADTLAERAAVSPERLAQARADQPFSPWVAMGPVFGATFTEAHLPATKRLFDETIQALSRASGAAKAAYMRRRPFLEDPRVLQCDPPPPGLAESGSYPSGHGAGGWSWALIMAELVPSRTDAILLRGLDYGDSRVICGFHYPSDIEAGRVLAAAVIARLHADPAFRRDLEAARRELARAYPR